MQPTYLPWLGYLDLMDQVDTFVLLDTVQFDYRSWQHRNRIPGPGGKPTWVSVPVTKHSRRAPIRAVEIAAGGEFPDRHVNLLRDRYRAAPDPDRLDGLVEQISLPPSGLLVDLTGPLLTWLAGELEVDTSVVWASTLAGTGSRSELLASLSAAVGADRYVSPPGSLDYLAEDHAAFTDRGIEVLVHRYEHPVYDQGAPFQSHCSAADLILRHPGHAAEVLRSGHRAPVPLAEALEAVA
jgi:hypothetical protein